MRPADSSELLNGWVLVTERMPVSGQVVLACCTNSAGAVQCIRASWIATKTVEADTDIDTSVFEYDEATDRYWTVEGWYERIDNWGDHSAVAVTEGAVTHWMPLPALPNATGVTTERGP